MGGGGPGPDFVVKEKTGYTPKNVTGSTKGYRVLNNRLATRQAMQSCLCRTRSLDMLGRAFRIRPVVLPNQTLAHLQ